MTDKIYLLIRCNKKTGKIDTVLEACYTAGLELWALRNTTKTKSCFIFEKDTGNIVYFTEGTDRFPKVLDGKKQRLGNIDDICSGLLEEMRKQDAAQEKGVCV